MTTDIKQRILKLAASPKGFYIRMLPELPRSSVDAACRALERAGELHGARLGHRTVAWFADKLVAHAAMDKAGAEKARGHEYASAKKPRMLDRGEAVVPGHVQIQYGPAYTPRFQAVAPGIAIGGNQRGRV